MKRIGIIVAMPEEYELARAVLPCRQEHRANNITLLQASIDGIELILAQCGIGKVNATIGAVKIIHQYAPDLIINTGVAGSLDPTAAVMDIIVGNEIAYHDVWCGNGNAPGQIQGLPPRFPADRQLYRAALSITPPRGRVHGGLICSGDRFIDTRQELQKIKTRFPEALAVDMESAALAQTCHLHHLPFIAYRLISDTPGIEGHDQQYRDFWKEAPLHSFETLRALVRQITQTPS
jgi:adenosylhomocysteine nucleosidase